MSLFVRPALITDLHAVHYIFSEMGYPDLDIKKFAQTWEELHLLNSSGILVADHSGTVVGFAIYTTRPVLSLPGTMLSIDGLGVLTKARGQGIGTNILDEVVTIAKRNGIKLITLSTNRQRESYKRQFYIKYGFTEKDSAWLKLELY